MSFAASSRATASLSGIVEGGMEEAEVAGFHEPVRDHAVGKMPDELEGLEAHEFLDSGLGVGVGEGDRVLAYAYNGLLGDGAAKDVGGKLAQGTHTGVHRTCVHAIAVSNGDRVPLISGIKVPLS